MPDIYSYDDPSITSELDRRLLQPREPDAERVYICSPLRGQTPEETYRNMMTARRYMLAAALEGMIPIAPHAYLPLLLNDSDDAERELALAIGQMLLVRCDKLYVCGRRISDGMRGEIAAAILRDMTICVFHTDLPDAVRAIAKAEGRSADIQYVANDIFRNSSIHERR